MARKTCGNAEPPADYAVARGVAPLFGAGAIRIICSAPTPDITYARPYLLDASECCRFHCRTKSGHGEVEGQREPICANQRKDPHH
jgi:hypothetical protein